MGTIDYKQSWQRRLWQFLDAVSVNLTSDDLSISVVDDRTRKSRQGEIYHFSRLYDGIPAGEHADVLLVTGEKRVTVSFATAVAAESIFRLYEGTVTTDDGTALSKVNRNRNVTTTFTSNVFHTPTVSSQGTRLSYSYFPAGRSNRKVGASGEEIGVWLLKPNTKYLIRITNVSGGDERVGISGDVFEDVI